jgi:hypothetical protein
MVGWRGLKNVYVLSEADFAQDAMDYGRHFLIDGATTR